jgi:GntR family transcriptional regulator
MEKQRPHKREKIAHTPWGTPPTRNHELPLYQQIREAINRQIEMGQLPPGSLLPPEIELARDFGVSRYTMRAALDTLVRNGLLERQRGKGSVIIRPPIQQSLSRFYSVAHEMLSRGANLKTKVLERGYLSASHELAQPATQWLDIEDPDQIGYLWRLRLVDEAPFLLEWLTFPAALCPDLLVEPVEETSDLAAGPFYDALTSCAGIVVSRARETLRPALVMGQEANLLQAPQRTPVFLVERFSMAGEQPVEWRRSLVHGGRYGYTADLINPTEEGDAP